MIRTYFEMLIGELAAEEVAGTNPDKAKQTREGGGHSATGREYVGKMKQFASWFTHGVPGGGGLRKAIYEAKTGETVLAAVDQFFEARFNSPALDTSLEEALAKEDLLASTAAYCD